MNKGRLVAFTDAVLAIIITIIVLDLKHPTFLTWQAFWQLRSNFTLCYFLFLARRHVGKYE